MAHAPIEVYQGDMLAHDWFDADIIYLSALCFGKELIERIAELFGRLKRGTRIISLKELPERPYLNLYAAIKIRMSWGLQLAFFYKIV